tara:strand:- start:299 stop:793 length:495 start_codon:yes stop_codon:yes gene_type:complete
MSNKQIVNLDYLDREAQLFKQARNNINENTKIVREAIDKHTKTEVEAVQNAILNLNKKVQQILETDFVKEKTEIIEKSEEQMIKSSKLAAQTFFKVRKIIHEKQELTQEQKMQYEHKLYNKIIDKFMTPEEKELFNRIVRSGNVILMGSHPSLGNGQQMQMLGL